MGRVAFYFYGWKSLVFNLTRKLNKKGQIILWIK